MDIANSKGTPIRVTADGTVMFSGWRGTFGRVVVVNHGHGYSTIYAHNFRNLVKAGEKVKRGQIIALMGSSGLSTGSHLHYEVRFNRRPQNPIKYITAKGSRKYLTRF